MIALYSDPEYSTAEEPRSSWIAAHASEEAAETSCMSEETEAVPFEELLAVSWAKVVMKEVTQRNIWQSNMLVPIQYQSTKSWDGGYIWYI
jgi:hypothetical protein